MKEVKKELQKVIKTIREQIGVSIEFNGQKIPSCSYPKAVFTEKQMQERQATIDCSYDLTEEHSRDMAIKVLKNPVFTAFLEKHNASANTEDYKKYKYTFTRVRVHFH